MNPLLLIRKDMAVDSTSNYLTFTANEANSTVRLDKVGSPNNITLEYSTDNGTTWNNYTWNGNTGDTITLTNMDDNVKFRGTNSVSISNDNSNYHKFVMSGSISASGDINTLLNTDGGDITLPTNCYLSLFTGCTVLTSAPELPATTLSVNCYRGMFYGCSSLVIAPELPATTLSDYCYQSMFKNCSSLAIVPVLPAAVLTEHCYYQMLMNCTLLNSITCLATDISASGCTIDWLRGVFNSGTFTKASSMEGWIMGGSGIPYGWTVVDAQ